MPRDDAWVPTMSYQISEHFRRAEVSVDLATFEGAPPSKVSASTALSTRAFQSALTS
jgi:hypothetical protein